MPSAMEQPVTFPNKDGYTLFGMMYLPDAATARGVGIIICVNAVKYRLGTFRLHVLLARRLVALGFHVFTFDPTGIGDSEGVFQFKSLSGHYFDIQNGKYSNDLRSACDYFTQQCALESVLLLGLCGGAISVLMEATSDERVKGLILLNIPVLTEDLKSSDRESGAAKITSREEASRILFNKILKLVNLDFWKRFLLLRVDFQEETRLVIKSMTVLGRKAAALVLRAIAGSHSTVDIKNPVSDNPLFNMHFQKSFFSAMSSGKSVLFVFAALDPWTWIFKSEFQDCVLGPGNPFAKECQVSLIPDANHIFSATESRVQLERVVVSWLEDRYPAQAQCI